MFRHFRNTIAGLAVLALMAFSFPFLAGRLTGLDRETCGFQELSLGALQEDWAPDFSLTPTQKVFWYGAEIFKAANSPPPKEFEFVVGLAEAGDACAQLALASAYGHHQNDISDREAMRYWARKGALKGHRLAMASLATRWEYGDIWVRLEAVYWALALKL